MTAGGEGMRLVHCAFLRLYRTCVAGSTARNVGYVTRELLD
jgi:hypothetical protein